LAILFVYNAVTAVLASLVWLGWLNIQGTTAVWLSFMGIMGWFIMTAGFATGCSLFLWPFIWFLAVWAAFVAFMGL
jgi:hypothetical protein|tara:strand:+ start:136 stop:363 length:228 start_codon:yes stop_codon:yes gene_type:complete